MPTGTGANVEKKVSIHANGLKGYTVMSKAELYRELFGEQQKKEAFSKKETLKAEPVLQPSSTDAVRRRRLRSF